MTSRDDHGEMFAAKRRELAEKSKAARRTRDNSVAMANEWYEDYLQGIDDEWYHFVAVTTYDITKSVKDET